jgi:hypothetical protein
MDSVLLVLLPGTGAEDVPVHIGRIQQAFECWRAEQGARLSAARMAVGYSTCRSDDDLVSMLEVASAVMHQEQHSLSA